MKKQLLLIVALLSMGLAHAMGGLTEAFNPTAHPRDAKGKFVKRTANRGYARGHRRGGRPKLTLVQRIDKNAKKIERTEAAIAALEKVGDTKHADEFKAQLKNQQEYRTELLGEKKAHGKGYARGGVKKKGWLETLGLGGLGYGKKGEADKTATKTKRKTLTEDEKKARKEAREKRQAERAKKGTARRAAVKKTIAEA